MCSIRPINQGTPEDHGGPSSRAVAGADGSDHGDRWGLLFAVWGAGTGRRRRGWLRRTVIIGSVTLVVLAAATVLVADPAVATRLLGCMANALIMGFGHR